MRDGGGKEKRQELCRACSKRIPRQAQWDTSAPNRSDSVILLRAETPVEKHPVSPAGIMRITLSYGKQGMMGGICIKFTEGNG